MWIYAKNIQDSKIAVIMNNTIKRTSKGILSLNNQRIRVPILRNFNLFELR